MEKQLTGNDRPLHLAKENDKTTAVFLKGAFHVDDIHGLYNVRDALNLAISIAEENSNEDADWDE